MTRAPEEFGPYLVYEQLGAGGMATVHRAVTRGIAGFQKQVALKRMLPSVAADANLVKSFIREAQLASKLRHSNVAQTYDLGKVGDTYFIAMEYIAGRTLRALVKHCAGTFGFMPVPVALNIVCQICDALEYAHNLTDDNGRSLGMIHRDVSPSNIIVSDGGVVKLIDFGIAKAASSNSMNTNSGTLKGKFSYMAPEYLDGRIDARADLFAAGIILHELLANRPLFRGRDDLDTLYRVKEMVVPPPSQLNPRVPHELDSIVLTALERDPDERWQRANALRQALSTVVHRLDLVAHNADVATWIESAFAGIDGASPARSLASRRPLSEADVDLMLDPSASISAPSISIRPGTLQMNAAEIPSLASASISRSVSEMSATASAVTPTTPESSSSLVKSLAQAAEERDDDQMDGLDGQETLVRGDSQPPAAVSPTNALTPEMYATKREGAGARSRPTPPAHEPVGSLLATRRDVAPPTGMEDAPNGKRSHVPTATPLARITPVTRATPSLARRDRAPSVVETHPAASPRSRPSKPPPGRYVDAHDAASDDPLEMATVVSADASGMDDVDGMGTRGGDRLDPTNDAASQSDDARETAPRAATPGVTDQMAAMDIATVLIPSLQAAPAPREMPPLARSQAGLPQNNFARTLPGPTAPVGSAVKQPPIVAAASASSRPGVDPGRFRTPDAAPAPTPTYPEAPVERRTSIVVLVLVLLVLVGAAAVVYFALLA